MLTSISMISCNGSGLEEVFVAMQQNKNIRHLSFYSCYWEDHISDIIASSIPIMELHSLSLVDMNIAADGLPYLFRNIEHCRQLVALDLSHNELGPGSIHLLTKSMVVQKQISKLSLSMCELDDQCMMELARGLRNHPAITSLDISKNTYISDEGVIFLKDLVKFNNSVTVLSVYDCFFSQQSIHAIESGLRYNKSYLKKILSHGFYCAVDSIVNSPKEKKGQNVTVDPAVMCSFGTITEERDADEAIATHTKEERKPPNDGTTEDTDELSIMTEIYAV